MGTSSSNPPGRTTAAIQKEAVRSELMGGILPSHRQALCEIDHGRQDSVTGLPSLRNQDRWRNGGYASRGDGRSPASPPPRPCRRSSSHRKARRSGWCNLLSWSPGRSIDCTAQQCTRQDAAARALAVPMRLACSGIRQPTSWEPARPTWSPFPPSWLPSSPVWPPSSPPLHRAWRPSSPP